MPLSLKFRKAAEPLKASCTLGDHFSTLPSHSQRQTNTFLNDIIFLCRLTLKKPEAISNNQHRLGPNQSSTEWLQTEEKEHTQRSRALVLLQGHTRVLSSIPVCFSASSSRRCRGDDCCWGQTHTASRSSPLPSSHRLHQGSHSDYKEKLCPACGRTPKWPLSHSPLFPLTLCSYTRSASNNIQHNF